MTEADPLRTCREETTLVTEELGSAGFEDAVEIGRGGFGVVYRCAQVALDRTVAVKVLTAELDSENQARFLREQRAMGRLTGHPNIVTVLEAGTTASGQPYLVMPYHPLNSLDAWIRRHGPLAVENALTIGVKIAGALESAHRLGIVHRDVKPGNILLTDYGEPALTDFGIAHIAGGFQTSEGTLVGSPAFTAPEVLEGEAPTPAADVYGLGATLFCAFTGHAAFERRSGEKVVAQFLRITTDPVPDLRENGIPGDVSAVVESAMSRNRHQRPSAAAFGEAVRRVQRHHGLQVDEMALHGEPASVYPPRKQRLPTQRAESAAMDSGSEGDLPLELTSFVGRRTEVAEVRNLLSTSRLVTLTGTGGVGKTRLALRIASSGQPFPHGVWMVELAAVSDASLLVDVVAARTGAREQLGKAWLDVLVEYLSSRKALLVLDNCEHMVDAVAELTGTLLRSCPNLRILVTSREPLNIAGEAVLRLSPLAVPEPDQEPTLLGLSRFDAVTLFTDRAAAAVPGFELDEDNKSAIARICARLDGLPLAIELAAARMRTISPQQILKRLDDRYALLTRGTRNAPARQQTLRWCVDWSYELCTAVEQRLWSRLSIFTGSFELDDAEQICGTDLTPDSPLDVLSSLLDKSILIREQTPTVVRFRLLETLRHYGREKLQEFGEYDDLRRRHREWYQQLALNAEAEWISDRQPDWIARLEREQPNLREALETCLSEETEEAARAGLNTAAALYEFWTFRGLFGEGRYWIDRVLAHSRTQLTPDRVRALCVGSQLAAEQGDFEGAAKLLNEGRALSEQTPTAAADAHLDYSAGVLALVRGESATASSSFERALEVLTSDKATDFHVSTLTLLGLAYEMRGDMTRATERYREVVSITEARGELLFRSVALRGIALAAWQQDERSRTQQQLLEALRLNRRLRSPLATAFSLESLAWTASADGAVERAAVLMGAAMGRLWPRGNNVTAVFPNMSRFHEECEQRTRDALGARRYEAAFRRGHAMSIDAAIAYALGEQPTKPMSESAHSLKLTKRERQVAGLVAQGLSNKQIAAKLVISQRTAEGHVEHILTKLAFTSRAQIAAWIAEDAKGEAL
ncbi:protein kinase domain-containing protein [Nocardia vinacea]|uniref:protein kinase domain-containing protein n=1 Tax=Nocardia vinacea TaxID=96468 RepID=UPI0002D2BB59|nr:protein kinase [Nocardia vinacea]